MTQQYDASRRLYIDDDGDHLRVVQPAERARAADGQVPQQAAASFLLDNADAIGVDPRWLTGAALAEPSLTTDGLPDDGEVELRLSEEKPGEGLTTVSYQQTWRGIPVWGAGATVSLRTDPLEVAAATSTCFDRIDVEVPQQFDGPAEVIARRHLNDSLGIPVRIVKHLEAAPTARATSRDGRAEVVSEQVVVFRYDAARRLSDVTAAPVTGLDDAGPVEDELPFPGSVPDAPDLGDGSFRLAKELVVRLVGPGGGEAITWRAIIDLETGGLLYLRALAAHVTGLVLARDPFTAGSTAGPGSSNATLNPLRSAATLVGLRAPAPGAAQALDGDTVTLAEVQTPTIAAPTRAVGSNFDFDARTDNFGAVNCYVHNDAFFRLAESLGFTKAGYFPGTTFPTRVDHRGSYSNPPTGIAVNASCHGNGTSGIDFTQYQLADTTDTANPLNIGTDRRVVLHELGGHGILYNHVNAANFGFAHSVGDSFAAVVCDPDTLAPDRFQTFPWLIASRRHDRAIGAGWAFGGSQDVGGYNTEQILSTTHFRLYRSLGGDSSWLDSRRFAARVTAYLLFKAVGTLTPATNPGNVTGWINALLAADAADWTSAGLAGGAYAKVIRWAFEKQGVYQAPGAPVPVTREGAPPAQDVYIDDGRHGEYQYQPVHWQNQNVWNRRYDDAGTAHEDPWLNRVNYAYTRVRNRGTQTATGVQVRAYNTDPGAGLVWPDNWRAMTTPVLTAPDIPPGGEVVVGPFRWTPTAADHECLLMIASSSGDPSNVGSFGTGESIAEWRLVPHDNNCGQRNVHPVPAGAGLEGIVAELDGRTFTVHNPFDGKARMQVVITLPAVLEKRGWKITARSEGGLSFGLGSGERRRVVLAVEAGEEIHADDVRETEDRSVVVSVSGNGILLGGMTYQLDPDRTRMMPQDEGKDPRDGHEHEHGDTHEDEDCEDDREACATKARELLKCLDLPVDGIAEVRIRSIQVDIDLEC